MCVGVPLCQDVWLPQHQLVLGAFMMLMLTVTRDVSQGARSFPSPLSLAIAQQMRALCVQNWRFRLLRLHLCHTGI